MPYVSRDENGGITAIFARASKAAPEELSNDHPDILAFLGQSATPAPVQDLSMSDAEMGRVLEDLIECLVDKRLILLKDLPPPALTKISYRRKLRESL